MSNNRRRCPEGIDGPWSRPKRPREDKPDVRCPPCARLFSAQGLRELNSPDGFAHRTRHECFSSRSEGCSLCGFILELVLGTPHGAEWTVHKHLVFRNGGPVVETRESGINVLYGGFDDTPDILAITPFAEAADPAAALIPRRPLRRNFRSNSVFAAAKRLIHACMKPDEPQEAHTQCRYSRDTTLPTRVLDLGGPESADSSLRLQVNEVETHGSYLALSYCWGKHNPKAGAERVQLRKDNTQDLISGIDLESLPQSIRDAVVVTRKLGFRYLWVDALCIIQDDRKDKDREISDMATIYKNAVVTLAASVAKSSKEGFLNRSTAPYLPDYAFTIPMPDSRVGTVYLAAEAREPDHPLDKRGWALQEFMLSSRLLVFSDHELLWQCNEVPLRSVTSTDPPGYRQRLQSLPWVSFDDGAEPHFGTLDFDKVYLWKTIVHQYTDRQLTDRDDRLRAVSGVVSELEKVWRDASVYGHWKAWFVQLLAWYKPEVDKVGRRYLKRAPSWSWVSVDGGIRYEDPLDVEDPTVKTLTVARVVINCRVLSYDDIDADRVESVLERPDLKSPAAMKELGDGECAYLLLGSTRVDGREKGVGLMILQVANGQYRRVGVVIFTDMSVWEGVRPQDVILEPKTH